MKIRYKKAAGVLFVSVSTINIVRSFVEITSRGATPLHLVASTIGLIISLHLFKTPYFGVDENGLVIYNFLTGKALRNYPLNSIHDLIIENNKIYLKKGNKKEKLPISKWWVDSGDWQALAERIKR